MKPNSFLCIPARKHLEQAFSAATVACSGEKFKSLERRKRLLDCKPTDGTGISVLPLESFSLGLKRAVSSMRLFCNHAHLQVGKLVCNGCVANLNVH
jgi:hypothetical protein